MITELKGRSYKVGVIKHDAHRFDIDYPGIDSYCFTSADSMLISSASRLALVKRHAQSSPLEGLIDYYFLDVALDTDIPLLDLNKPTEVTDFILAQLSLSCQFCAAKEGGSQCSGDTHGLQGR